MATLTLTDNQTRADFFQHCILTNVRYWQGYVSSREVNLPLSAAERDAILKAIVFALELQANWEAVRDLALAFSTYMERSGHWEIWRCTLNYALKAAWRSEDTAGVVALTMLQARLWQWQAEAKQAAAQYRQVIRLARQLSDRFSEARACSNLGFLFMEQGYWQRAETLCCHALTIFEQLDNLHGLAHTENHLGILYTYQRRWEQAIRHLEQACRLWQKKADDHGLMRGSINLGVLYNEMDQPDQALLWLERALQLAKLTAEESEIGAIYINMSITYRLKDDLFQAEACAWQAEIIFHRLPNRLGLARVYDNLGLIYLDRGQWSEAFSYFQTALALWRELGHQKSEIRTRLYLVKYEAVRGNHLHAAHQLAEVETLIGQFRQGEQEPYWQPLLLKCRRQVKAGAEPQSTPAYFNS